MKKVLSWGLIAAMLFNGGNVVAFADQTGKGNEKKEYIIVTKNKKELKTVTDIYQDNLTDEYEESNYLEENNVVVLELSDEQVKKLEKRAGVEFVEEDVLLNANSLDESTWQEEVTTGEMITEETATEDQETAAEPDTEEPSTNEPAVDQGSTEEYDEEELDGTDFIPPLVDHDDQEMFEDEIIPLTPDEENRWNVKAIHAVKTEIGSVDGLPKVKVGILDSGVDPISDIEEIHNENFVAAEGYMEAFREDGTGHATSIASVIGSTQDGRGIVGVNPNAELYSIKVLDENNQASVSRIIEGLMWAKDNGIQIINMSFSTPVDSTALHNAIKEVSEAGVLLIGSGGNSKEALEYPAAYEEVISVGAVDNKMQVTDFTPGGVDLLAPGEGVFASGLFGGYTAVTGTSIAAAHVTGVASLIWQKDPSVNSELIKKVLFQSANPISEQAGYGLIDAKFAMDIYEGVKSDKKAVQENSNLVKDYSDETYVVGRWMGVDHGDIVSDIGAQHGFKDDEITWIKRFVQKADSSEYNSTAVIALHGRKNYVANTKYLYTLALNLYQGQSDSTAIKNADAACIGVNPELKVVVRDQLLKTQYYDAAELKDSKIKGLKVLGFTMHLAGDTFAHRTMVPMSEESDKNFDQKYFSTVAHSPTHSWDLLPVWCKEELKYSKSFCNRWVCFKTSKRNGHLEFIDIKYFFVDRDGSNQSYEDNTKFYPSRFTMGTNHATNIMLKTFAAGTGWQRKVFTSQFDGIDYKLRQNNLYKYYQAAGLDTSFNGTRFKWESVGTMELR